VIRAGKAFWEPGGDVIHYHQDGNNRADQAVDGGMMTTSSDGNEFLSELRGDPG
jgi:hypothetical protein